MRPFISTVFTPQGLLRFRVALPPMLITLGVTEHMANRIRRAADEYVQIYVGRSMEGCDTLLRRSAECVLVMQIPSRLDDAAAADLIAMRRRFPKVPVLSLFLEGHSFSGWVLKLGSEGVAELVSVGSDFPTESFLNALASCHVDGLSAKIWREARIQVPDDLGTILYKALRISHGVPTVFALAGVAGLHERTLRKHCAKRNYPSPQWIIGCARVLIVAYYLEEPGRSIQSISEILGFGSVAALSNMVRRYTKMTPSQLRQSGATARAARLIEERLM